MEIKQGDKVRVSEDAPRMYVREWAENRYCKVAEVEDDNAIITNGSYIIAIPTKYLIKVDAEAKEPKFKVGDMVRINHRVPYWGHNGKVGRVNFITKEGKYCIFGVPCEWDEENIELYTEPTAPKFKVGDRVRNTKNDECGIVQDIKNGVVEVCVPYVKPRRYWNTGIAELVPPSEQTEAEETDSNNFKKEAEKWANTVSNAIKKYGNVMCQTYIDAHTEAYWDAYTADLAKEVALKVANKYNTPRQGCRVCRAGCQGGCGGAEKELKKEELT